MSWGSGFWGGQRLSLAFMSSTLRSRGRHLVPLPVADLSTRTGPARSRTAVPRQASVGQGLQGPCPRTCFMLSTLSTSCRRFSGVSRACACRPRPATRGSGDGSRRGRSCRPAVVRAPPLRPAHADPQPLLQTGRGAAESGAAEHLPRSISAVQHFHRVLKPGGCLVFDYVRSDGTGLDTAAALGDRVPTFEFILKHFDIIQGRVTTDGAHVETVAARKR